MTERPETIINKYVWEQFKTEAPAFYNSFPQTVGGSQFIPFFPAGVANVPNWVIEQDLPYIVFDKFTKVRTGKYKYFYPIKSEQMRYTIYGGSLPGYPAVGIEGNNYNYTPGYQFDRYGFTINLTSLITLILDREDQAAKDINEFSGELYEDSNPYFKYNFHCINVFQSGYAESQQDVANLMEYRPTRDLIIKYDYHSPQYKEHPSLL
jgi:hypothetical protein